MIILPPYLYDRETYPLVNTTERLFMNKLWLAEQLGYDCGPVGTDPGLSKDYCVRPIMNLHGNAEGGVYKFNSDVDIAGLANQAGYFWNEWFDGVSNWTEYLNDEPVYGLQWKLEGATDAICSEFTTYEPLPVLLKGLSRHLLVERLGDKIIEVGFRFMGTNARQEAIDDYKAIDPDYDPTDIEFGLFDMRRKRAAPYLVRGWYYEDIKASRRART